MRFARWVRRIRRRWRRKRKGGELGTELALFLTIDWLEPRDRQVKWQVGYRAGCVGLVKEEGDLKAWLFYTQKRSDAIPCPTLEMPSPGYIPEKLIKALRS